MTLISSISNIGSIYNKKTTSSMLVSNKSSNSNSSISFDNNHSASLLDTDIMANLLGILGIHIKAKVL